MTEYKGETEDQTYSWNSEKTGVDLNAPEDLTEATKSPNFYGMSRDQRTLIELKFKYQLK